MKDTYTLDEAENELFGKRGTPEREQYEAELKDELLACKNGIVMLHAVAPDASESKESGTLYPSSE